MDKYLGKWKLLKNIDFDNFLKYINYGWIKRKLSVSSNIDVTIEKTDVENKYKRIIESTFLNREEFFVVDGQFHTTVDKTQKSYTFKDGVLYTEAKQTNGIQWSETSELENNILTITRNWIENNAKKTSKQIFKHIS